MLYHDSEARRHLRNPDPNDQERTVTYEITSLTDNTTRIPYEMEVFGEFTDSKVAIDADTSTIRRDPSNWPRGYNIKKHETQKSLYLKKVFGLFSVQVLIVCAYLTLVKVKDPDGSTGLVKFATSWHWFTFFLAMMVVSLWLIVNFINDVQRKEPYNYIVWFLYTISMSYLVGFTALCHASLDIILWAFIATMFIAVAMLVTRDKLLSSTSKRDSKELLGPTFGILSLITVMSLFVFFKFPGPASSKVLLVIGMFLMLAYLWIDIKLIIHAKYYHLVTFEDHIYASVKLFADFCLCVSILVALITGER